MGFVSWNQEVKSMSSIIRFLRPSQQSNIQSLALLLLRLAVGCAFLIHGWQKIQNPTGWGSANSPIYIPPFFQLLAAVAEFGGGLAFVSGFLTRIAALGIMSTMSVAVYLLAFVMHEPFVNLTGPMSFELPVAYWLVAFLFLIFGAGQFSLDRAVFGQNVDLRPIGDSASSHPEIDKMLYE
jgi:putative oxidoreductase